MSNKPREMFFAQHGWGPYVCFFCEEEVGFTDVLIHHIDEDRSNNVITNFAAAHQPCHTRYHLMTRSPEVRAKMSQSNTGRKFTPEHRAKISAARKAYWARKKS